MQDLTQATDVLIAAWPEPVTSKPAVASAVSLMTPVDRRAALEAIPDYIDHVKRCEHTTPELAVYLRDERWATAPGYEKELSTSDGLDAFLLKEEIKAIAREARVAGDEGRRENAFRALCLPLSDISRIYKRAVSIHTHNIERGQLSAGKAAS